MSDLQNLIPRKELVLPIDINKAYSFLLIGSTRSGKSTLLNYLVEKYLKHKMNILMTESPNADIYKEKNFKKECLLVPSYMPQIIRECYLINKGTNNKYPFQLILDDVIGSRNCPQMKRLLTIYRNSGLGVCITGQSSAVLDKTGRNNCNFVFLGRVNSDAEAEVIVKSFLGSTFPPHLKLVEKIALYRKLTDKYHFIVLDNISGQVFLTKVNWHQK